MRQVFRPIPFGRIDAGARTGSNDTKAARGGLRQRRDETLPKRKRGSAASRSADGLAAFPHRLRSAFARTPALREHGANHELNLVEKHERKDDRADSMRREDHLRHRNAGGEALFRTAE